MSDPIDFYKILGLDVSALPRQIRRRYLKLATKYHPDKLDSSATEKTRDEYARRFDLVSQAYNCLSNPRLRKEYDLKFYTQRNIQTHNELAAAYRDTASPVANTAPSSLPANAPATPQEIKDFFAQKHSTLTDAHVDRNMQDYERMRRTQFEPEGNLRDFDKIRTTDIVKIETPEAIASHTSNYQSLDALGDMYSGGHMNALETEYVMPISPDDLKDESPTLDIKDRIHKYKKETQHLHNLPTTEYKFS